MCIRCELGTSKGITPMNTQGAGLPMLIMQETISGDTPFMCFTLPDLEAPGNRGNAECEIQHCGLGEGQRARHFYDPVAH